MTSAMTKVYWLWARGHAFLRRRRRPLTLGEHFMLTTCIGIAVMIVLLVVAHQVPRS